MTPKVAPERLIDPDGEGAYYLAGSSSWTLQWPAWDFFGDARRWRDLDNEFVWMKPGEGDEWVRTRWRWWHGFLPNNFCPVGYAYVTPKPER